MNYETILYEAAEGVAVITLNRPDRLNAMTTRMWEEMHAAVSEAIRDAEVRAIVLTGAGRGFCAGADLARLEGLASGSSEEARPQASSRTDIVELPDQLDLPRGYKTRFAYLATVPKPVIAAVNGPAAGIGFVMALFSDVRFIAEDAKLTTAFAKRGLIAEYGLAWMLPRLIGGGRAAEIIYSSRVLLGREAAGLGLAHGCMPAEQVRQAALDYARQLARDVSPRSLRVMKRQFFLGLSQDVSDAVELAMQETALSLESEDFKESVAANREKRAPRFSGH